MTISPERADVAFLDPAELDPARQWLAIRDDVAIGVGSLRRTDDPERVDLGWLGVMKEQAHRRVALCRTMVGTCLASIRGQGMTVSLEIDAIDPEVDALIDELPVAWNNAWLTWRKGKTSRRSDSGNRQNVG